MDTENLILSLCQASGVSGDEEPAVRLAEEYLKKFCKTCVDNNGNLFAVLGNTGADKTILLDAHIDRIGFIVTGINNDGFVKVDKCGGIDIRTLPDSKVVLQSNSDIKGIICCMPPHLSDGKEDTAVPLDKTWVDFGMTCEKAKEKIKIGDILTLESCPQKLLNGKICAPALDNRCSVAALIKSAELLSDCDNLKYKVVIQLSVQEETYGTGAKTGAYSINPDEAIIVDVSFASQPDISGQYSEIHLAKGPMICISPILNRQMGDKLISLAKEKKINFQLEPLGGTTGTNADSISVSRRGVKTAVISIPEKNMHTGVEIISVDDVESTASLIAEYIKCGGAFDD